MQNKFAVRYLPAAQTDLTEIFDFIATDNQESAIKFINKLDDRIKLLEQQPLMGTFPKDEKLKDYGYRILIIESYLVFYLIKGKTVEIQRVIHGSRNLEDLI